jgi:hypothetical protein
MEIGGFKPLLIGAIQIKYDEATVSGDARRAPALKELLEILEEASGTESSFALAWGEYMQADHRSAREAALDRALQEYFWRTERASEPRHFLSDLANYYRMIGGWSRDPRPPVGRPRACS